MQRCQRTQSQKSVKLGHHKAICSPKTIGRSGKNPLEQNDSRPWARGQAIFMCIHEHNPEYNSCIGPCETRL